MTKQHLKDEIWKQLKGNEKAVRFLTYKLDTPSTTVRYWINKNHINLTLPEAVKQIRKFLGLPAGAEIVEEKSMSDTTTDL